MPSSFPTTPRAPNAVRLAVAVVALVALALATRTTITSSAWVGTVFPGFLLLDNRVIPSVGLASWSGAAVPGLFQSELVAVDGVAVDSAGAAYALVAARPPGVPVRYTVRRGGDTRELVVPTQRFGLADWVLLHGAFLVNGIVFLASGLIVAVLRPASPMARGLMAWGGACALFLLTAMDLYGPATFFRLHVVGEALLAPALLHLTLVLPQPHARARWRLAGYGVAFVLLACYQLLLYRPAGYSAVLTADMGFLGLAGLLFAGRLVGAYRHSVSLLARQRVRVITLGALLGFGLPASVLLASAALGGRIPMNLAAFTPFVFALALAYAVVVHDLFEIDAMVKRGAYYLLLSAAVAAAYLAAVGLFDRVLRPGAITGSSVFPVVFALTVLLLLDPLRVRLQALVDRLFFRTSYDSAHLVADVGRRLATTMRREQIAALVCETASLAVPEAGARLFVADDDPATPQTFREPGRATAVPPALVAPLAEGRVVTTFDPPELYADAEMLVPVRRALLELGAEVAVPLQLRGLLVGALTIGPRRAGRFYTSGDAEFLRALAHQAAIALANARSYEEAATLNATLESRVRERTRELEAANRDLASTYAELKTTEARLVHTEKMASLGRLVAGVAHEINNPVSFIASNVAPLRRRLTEAAKRTPPEGRPPLDEANDIADVMARGAERTAAIVRDLRSFSRLDEATRKRVALEDGLETSLRLLTPRWRERITLHRDYGVLPAVECDPGQMNQVFLNVLANAADAVEGPGNVWITTRHEGNRVTVTVRDDGRGLDAETIARVFDPFFTTKDVGGGTGLGLAISHGIVTAHGGTIEITGAPGDGATVRITLPVDAPPSAAVTLGPAA